MYVIAPTYTRRCYIISDKYCVLRVWRLPIFFRKCISDQT